MKYRILKKTSASGKVQYRVQFKLFFLWWVNTECRLHVLGVGLDHDTLDEVKKELNFFIKGDLDNTIVKKEVVENT